MMITNNKLIGKKAILQTVGGETIPQKILENLDAYKIPFCKILNKELTIVETIRSYDFGIEQNNFECLLFKEIESNEINEGQYYYGYCPLPSSYFQIEASPNHPLTKIFQ